MFEEKTDNLRKRLVAAVENGKPITIAFNGNLRKNEDNDTETPTIEISFHPNGTIQGSSRYDDTVQATIRGTFNLEEGTITWHEIYPTYSCIYTGNIFSGSITADYVAVDQPGSGTAQFTVDWVETEKLASNKKE
jgi:hypothetical protein